MCVFPLSNSSSGSKWPLARARNLRVIGSWSTDKITCEVLIVNYVISFEFQGHFFTPLQRHQ